MPKHYRNSRKFKLILAAIAGFTLAGLSWKLGETVVRTCEVIDWIAWIAIVVLRPIISSVWQAFASCFFGNSAHGQFLFQLVTSIWPVLFVLAA